MTRRVYLHVGAPKSGTTYLQRVLRHNQVLLAEHGVLVAGRTHAELVHAGFVVREDRRLRDLPPRAAGAWDRVVAQVRDFPGESAVVSYELLAGARRGQAERAIASFDGLEVHVVVTTRDLGRAVSSAWQERLKFALATPLEEWRPRRAKEGPRAEWGWRTMNPASVAQRWGSSLPPERVHIVTAPRGRGDPTALWDRFAEACGIEGVRLDLSVPPVNESLGVKAVEVLRRVNEQDLGPIEGAREQSKWLRDTLAHAVLAPLDDEPIAITPEQLADAQLRAAAALATIETSGWQVHGDLEDVRATARAARLPSEVPAEELLDVATRTIVALLLELRTTSRGSHRPEASEPAGRLSSMGALVRNLPGRSELDELAARLAAVDAQVQEDRRLHERVAVLTDLVGELLLPGAQLDRDAMQEALLAYRKRSL